MPIEFPDSPALNQSYSYNGKTWIWNATGWQSAPIVGYTGSKGDTGYTGSKGDTGYNESIGGLGYTGSQGVIGYTGSIGDTGYAGSEGSGPPTIATMGFDSATVTLYSSGEYKGLINAETEGTTLRTDFTYDAFKRVTGYSETTGGVTKTVVVTYDSDTGGVSTITVT